MAFGKPFKKGEGGRPKGSKNRVTMTLRQALEESFTKRGGVKYLETLDDRDYVGLLGKLMPIQIEGGDPARPIVLVDYTQPKKPAKDG